MLLYDVILNFKVLLAGLALQVASSLSKETLAQVVCLVYMVGTDRKVSRDLLATQDTKESQDQKVHCNANVIKKMFQFIRTYSNLHFDRQ